MHVHVYCPVFVCITWYKVISLWFPTHTNTNITSLLSICVCILTYVRAGKDGERRWMVGDGFRHFLILQTGLNSSNNDCMFIGTFVCSFLSFFFTPLLFLPTYLPSFLSPSYPPFVRLFVCSFPLFLSFITPFVHSFLASLFLPPSFSLLCSWHLSFHS